MKRKVIQIAQSTRLISLPKKWVDQYGVKKGDELEVTTDHNVVIISTEQRTKPERKITINISGFGPRSKKLIAALYSAGFDEIKVYYSNYDELDYVQRVVRESCIGFELIEQTNKFVRIKKVSETINEQFDKVLKRMMMYLITMGKECYNAIIVLDEKQLQYAIKMDESINKFSNFCDRVITINQEPESYSIYALVAVLESIGDDYKSLCWYARTHKLQLSKDTRHLFEEVNNAIQFLYDFIFDFNLGKLKKLYKERIRIRILVDKAEKKATKKEALFVHRLHTISKHMDAIDRPVIVREALRKTTLF